MLHQTIGARPSTSSQARLTSTCASAIAAIVRPGSRRSQLLLLAIAMSVGVLNPAAPGVSLPQANLAASSPTPISSSIAAGEFSSLALTSSGTVLSWGANYAGELGNGTTNRTGCACNPIPTLIPGLSGVVGVFGGVDFNFVLKSDGTLWAFGSNSEGQLGNGTLIDSSTPVQVSGLGGVVQATGSHATGYAVESNGTLWAWGWNTAGQLGNGTVSLNSTGCNCLETPAQVPGLSGVVAVAASGLNAMALTSDGTVWTWGDNATGEVGNNTCSSGLLDNTLSPVHLSAPTGITAIAATTGSNYALASDGTVWDWGSGALARPGTQACPGPLKVPGQVPNLSGVVAIAATRTGGGFFCCGTASAILADGTVWDWGDNSQCQLGNNSSFDSNVPVKVLNMSAAVAVVSGDQYSLAERSDGTLWAWGDDTNGSLGDGTTGPFNEGCGRSLTVATQVALGAPPATTVPRYVALGDSYSAGEGAAPFDPATDTAVDTCHRSTRAYAIQIVGQFGVPASSVEFWACSGAEIKDFYNSFSTEPRQLDRLNGAPVTLSTFGVGGNDIGFYTMAVTCTDVTALIKGQQNQSYQANCAHYLEQPGQLQPMEKITMLTSGIQENGTTYSLPALYTSVHGQAPAAQVFVVGYPDPLPRSPNGDCTANVTREDPNNSNGLTFLGGVYHVAFTIHQSDVMWMTQVINSMNTEIQADAIASNFIFVDNYHTFDNGDVCSSHPLVNGVTLKNDSNDTSRWSYHPNVAGQTQIAKQVAATIAGNAPGVQTFAINPQQTIQQALTVGAGLQQLAVQTTWPGSDVQLSLVSPTGTVYDRSTQGAGVIHRLQANAETLAIFNPQPGQWTVRLYGANVSAAGEPVHVYTTQIPLSAFAPVPYLTASTDRGVAPTSVQFSAQGSASFAGATIASYNWDFGDGSPASTGGVTVSHVFTAAGNYTVTLTVTDSLGQSGSATRSVFVNSTDQPPSAKYVWDSLDPSNPTSVAVDGTPSTDVDGQITNYAWDFGDGTSGSGSLASHTFAGLGTYPVRLTVTDNGGLSGSTCLLVTTGQSSGATGQPCPALTITASDGAMTYGGGAPTITPGYSGFINGDTAASLTSQPSCTSTATPTTPAGTYPGATSCAGAVDSKYLINYQNGQLLVNPAQLTITAQDVGIVYGDPIPASTYQINGYVNGQNLASSGVTGTPSCTTSAIPSSPAGAYPITCTAGSLTASNYKFAFVPGTLSIAKHSATLRQNGQMFFSTGTGTTAAVNLSGTLAADPGGNPDVTLAAPVFNLYKSTNTSMGSPDVTCPATVSSTGVVSCSLPALGIDNWTVVLQLPSTDGYFTARSSDPIVITVFQPTTGVFATGGGWIVDPSYRNMPVAISSQNSHGNFGFNVRYESGTTTPTGQVSYTFRGADGFDYVVKSTSWQNGGAAFSPTTASFGGAANVTVIDPSTGSAVSGLGGANFTFRIDINAATSGAPNFAISIYDLTGAIYHQAGTTANPIALGGGNIVIHS